MKSCRPCLICCMNKFLIKSRLNREISFSKSIFSLKISLTTFVFFFFFKCMYQLLRKLTRKVHYEISPDTLLFLLYLNMCTYYKIIKQKFIFSNYTLLAELVLKRQLISDILHHQSSFNQRLIEDYISLLCFFSIS